MSGFEPCWGSNVFFRLSPPSFYVVCFLSVDVSVPVRQVKLPLVAHSSLSRARPGSMVGATLNEESADQFVETFLVRDVSTLFYPILFMCPSWGIFKTWEGFFPLNHTLVPFDWFVQGSTPVRI